MNFYTSAIMFTLALGNIIPNARKLMPWSQR